MLTKNFIWHHDSGYLTLILALAFLQRSTFNIYNLLSEDISNTDVFYRNEGDNDDFEYIYGFLTGGTF